MDPNSAGVLRWHPRPAGAPDPGLPRTRPGMLWRQIREGVAGDRRVSLFSASFAGLATLLAATGLFGVLAYAVAQRTRELGLRMALGANAARLRPLVLGRVGRMMLAGGGAGLGATFAVGRFAQSLLYGIDV